MKVKDPARLPAWRLIDALREIQHILWKDENGWDPDLEWDEETIELVAEVLDGAGLKPQRRERAIPKPAQEHAQTLTSLIDGNKDDLAEILTPIRDFLSKQAAD